MEMSVNDIKINTTDQHMLYS